MSMEQVEEIAQDISRNTGDPRVHPRIYTLLALVLSREKLQELIVNDETRVSDLIARTGLRDVRTCLGEEFLPKRLLKFRYKFGVEKGKSLFQRKFPEDLIERVWEEIEESVQDAVQVVQDDWTVISLLENDLRRLKGERVNFRL